MTGATTVDGILGDIDLPIELSTDASQFGLMLRAEAHNARWLVSLDLSGARVDSTIDLTTPLPSVGARIGYELSALLLELGGGRRLGHWPVRVLWSDEPARLFVDLLLGGRYVRLDQQMESTLGRFEALDHWGEPFVGARLGARASDDLSFTLRGDVGGFGIPGASELTWVLVAEASWRFWRNVSLDAGYKLYDVDHSVAGGSLALDARLQGPVVGLRLDY